MECLEKFYEETGLSRTMFGLLANVSVESLRKYERSDTDRMRASTIKKIEDGMQKLRDIRLQVTPLYFGKGWMFYWNNPEPDKAQIQDLWGIKFIQRIAGLR